jgi:hypothetical protein
VSCFIDFAGELGTPFACYQTDRYGLQLIEAGDFSHKSWQRVECQTLFLPHPKQIEFFTATEPLVLFGGGRGGGKTAALVWDAIQTSYLVPGSRTIIFRRTMPELKKTIIEEFLRLPEDLRGKYNGSDHFSRIENGSTIWFASADDESAVRKLLSGEFHRMLFDEWSEWPYKQWMFASGSCRSTHEKDVFGNLVIAQVKGATNPGGTGGEALNSIFGCTPGKPKRQAPGEDPSTYNPAEFRFILSLVNDNPAYAADKPAGIAYRQMLNKQPPRIKAAWIDGRWDGFEGQYFDCLDESVTKLWHDDYLRLIQKQHWAPRWISIDWGMTHHAYAAWHALLKIGGRDIAVTYQELLIKGIGEAALAEQICDQTENSFDDKKVVKIYLSPETFGESPYSIARRMGNVFVARGLPRPTAAQNQRHGPKAATNGWRLMHDCLRQRFDCDSLAAMVQGESASSQWVRGKTREISQWLITDNCPHAWESLPQAECDPKTDGDVKKEGDAPHLDVNDGLRYGIASHVRPIDVPFEERVKEELSQLPVAGTDRYIKHLQLKQKEKTQGPDKPVYLGGNRRRR